MTSSSMEVAGAGFNFDSASKVSIVDSNVTDVSGGVIGGVFGSTGGTLEVSGSRFERATATLGGAFMAGSGSTTLTLRDSLLRDIGRGDGQWSWGNILLYDGPTATISGCRFQTSPIGWFYVVKVTAPFLPHPPPLSDASCISTHGACGLALIALPLLRVRLPSSSTTLALRPTSIWTLAPWR